MHITVTCPACGDPLAVPLAVTRERGDSQGRGIPPWAYYVERTGPCIGCGQDVFTANNEQDMAQAAIVDFATSACDSEYGGDGRDD